MPRTPPPEPDSDRDPAAWEVWEKRQRRNEAARTRRADRRDRLAYPADGTPLVAEAACEGTFFRPPPLPPSIIRVTVLLRTPQSFIPSDRSLSFEGGVSIEDLPLSWKARDRLWSALPATVFAALNAVNHPRPKGGVDVEFKRLDVVPPLAPDTSVEEFARFSEAFMAIVGGAVRMAFGGLVAYNMQPRYVDVPNFGPDWNVIRPFDSEGRGYFRSSGHPSREEAEAGLTDAQRDLGARVILARDVVSDADLSAGEPESADVRYGESSLTPLEAAQLAIDDWIFHLGLKRLRRVRGVRLDAPGGARINAGRGWEHFSFFRLQRSGDRG